MTIEEIIELGVTVEINDGNVTYVSIGDYEINNTDEKE